MNFILPNSVSCRPEHFFPVGWMSGMVKTFPVGCYFLSRIPDGCTVRFLGWLVKPEPSGNISCRLAVRKQSSFLSVDSWRSAVRNWIPDSFLAFPDGFRLSGISCSVVVPAIKRSEPSWALGRYHGPVSCYYSRITKACTCLHRLSVPQRKLTKDYTCLLQSSCMYLRPS